MNPINTPPPKKDADLVFFFELKNGKYLTRSGYEITTEMILRHKHAIHENNGYIVLPPDSELIKHTDWKVGDVFVTNFFSIDEVCIIRKFREGYVIFNRLESIRGLSKVEEDFCSAEIEIELFNKMKKTFIHHSEWYQEYKK